MTRIDERLEAAAQDTRAAFHGYRPSEGITRRRTNRLRPAFIGFIIAAVLAGAGIFLAFRQPASPATPTETTSPNSNTSTDITWTRYSLPDDFRIHSLTTAGGLVFGLAVDEIEAPHPRTRLWLSDDSGRSWEAVDVEAPRFGMRAGYFKEIVPVGGRYLAIVKGEDLETGLGTDRLVVSDDAATWARVDTGAGMPVGIAGGETGGIALICFDDAAARCRYEVMHTRDGVTWTTSPSPELEGVEPFRAVEWFDGRFYLVALRDGEPAQLVTSTDTSEWLSWEAPSLETSALENTLLDPGAVSGTLIALTRDELGPHTWALDITGSWVKTTPTAFDPALSGGVVPANAVLSDPAGAIAAIIDRGRNDGTQSAANRPPEIWWTADGETWRLELGPDAFGADGSIEAATVSDGQIIVVHHTFPSQNSLWVGDTLTAPEAAASTPTTLSTPQIPDGLQMACGEAIGPYSLNTDFSLQLDPQGEVALEALAALGEEGVSFTDDIAWGVWDRTDDTLVLFGTNDRGNAYARFDATGDGGWRPAGFGSCHWWAVPPNGYGIGTWVIDPAFPISEESTTVHVLATERSCTGGQPPDGREVEALVIPTPETVSIIITIEPPEGAQTCPGNPSFGFTVDLGEPLGSRDLVDGASIPPTPQGDTLCRPASVGEPGAQPGLPEPVAESRDILFWVASACYWPQVSSMATEQEGFLFDAGGGFLMGDPAPYWNTWRSERNTLELIATLLTRSYGTIETTTETGEPITMYVWPAVAAEENQGDDALWDELRGIYTHEQIRSIREGGEGYAGGFMVGIDEHGAWRFAVTMDV